MCEDIISLITSNEVGIKHQSTIQSFLANLNCIYLPIYLKNNYQFFFFIEVPLPIQDSQSDHVYVYVCIFICVRGINCFYDYSVGYRKCSDIVCVVLILWFSFHFNMTTFCVMLRIPTLVCHSTTKPGCQHIVEK